MQPTQCQEEDKSVISVVGAAAEWRQHAVVSGEGEPSAALASAFHRNRAQEPQMSSKAQASKQDPKFSWHL